jgi:hypothetical protein
MSIRRNPGARQWVQQEGSTTPRPPLCLISSTNTPTTSLNFATQKTTTTHLLFLPVAHHVVRVLPNTLWVAAVCQPHRHRGIWGNPRCQRLQQDGSAGAACCSNHAWVGIPHEVSRKGGCCSRGVHRGSRGRRWAAGRATRNSPQWLHKKKRHHVFMTRMVEVVVGRGCVSHRSGLGLWRAGHCGEETLAQSPHIMPTNAPMDDTGPRHYHALDPTKMVMKACCGMRVCMNGGCWWVGAEGRAASQQKVKNPNSSAMIAPQACRRQRVRDPSHWSSRPVVPVVFHGRA